MQEDFSVIIYVFTHKYYHDEDGNPIIKIGRIERGTNESDVDKRIIELSNATGVPGGFGCEYALLVKDKAVENKLHQIFQLERITRHSGRDSEFFTTNIEQVRYVLELCEMLGAKFLKHSDRTGDITTVNESGVIQTMQKQIKYTFEDLGVPIGSELIYKSNPTKKCITMYGRKVLFEDEIYSLSGLATKFAKENNPNRKTGRNGWLHFTYNGKTMDEIWNEFKQKI